MHFICADSSTNDCCNTLLLVLSLIGRTIIIIDINLFNNPYRKWLAHMLDGIIEMPILIKISKSFM